MIESRKSTPTQAMISVGLPTVTLGDTRACANNLVTAAIVPPVGETAEFITRAFSAGGVTFEVRCPSNLVRDAVEALLADLPEGDSATVEVITVRNSDEGKLTVHSGDFPSGHPQVPNSALATVVSAVTRLSLDAEPERLHLHCAGLSIDGKGVLISAPSGTGKTTLAASLASRGWTYVSDEALALDNDGTSARGFPKPLMIKPGARDLLPDLEELAVTLDPNDDVYWHVPATAMFASVAVSLEPVLVVILYQGPPGSYSPPLAAPMERADAVVALMAQTMDAERFGPDAVQVLARLAARCNCVSMPVGPLDDSVQLLTNLLQVPPPIAQMIDLDQAPKSNAGYWKIAETARSISIDGRVVVHDTAGGAIVALDEVGSGVWTSLAGQPLDWWQPEVMTATGTESFLNRLASLGLVSVTDGCGQEVAR